MPDSQRDEVENHGPFSEPGYATVPGESGAPADGDLSGLLDELTEITSRVFQSDKLVIDELRPVIRVLVEACVDRFQEYPFDVSEVLFSWLEVRGYPDAGTSGLVRGIEERYEKYHGRPLRRPCRHSQRPQSLDEEIESLRATLKYAALAGENHDQ